MNRLKAVLRHSLWPHKNNQFRPSLIRLKGLLAVLVLVVAVTGLTNFKNTGKFQVLSFATDVSIGGLFNETNQERAAVGLHDLVLDISLNAAAQAKAEHMIANDYWAHISPSGKTPWDFIDEQGYVYLKAGENLAYGFLTSSGTVDGWMASPGHKANILDTDFEEVGFGIANGSSFQNDENTVVVAMYALPYVRPTISLITPIEELPDSDAEDITPEQVTTPTIVTDESHLQVSTDPISYPIIELGEPVLDETVNARVTSVFGALLSGDAPLSLYIVTSLLLMVGLVYLLRHIRVIHHFIVVGEHTLEGHPVLEASIVYALIWLVLSATIGVVV